MQTSGLKESCSMENHFPGNSPSLFPFTTPSSLYTSPSFYLVFFQLIDLYLEAEVQNLRSDLSASLTPHSLLGRKELVMRDFGQAQWFGHWALVSYQHLTNLGLNF
uniref:Uncharacterized protein n=1 Tax=Ursus maritimus TaxID=29073 RepID=A0A452TK80_URSMA